MSRASFVCAIFCLTFLTACEKSSPPPPASPTPPAGNPRAASSPARPAAPSESEIAAMRSMVNSESAGSSAAAQPGAALPPGHPPISGTADSPAPPPAPSLPEGHPPLGSVSSPATPPQSGDLKFDAPSEWVAVPPRSNMRKAQFTLPHVASDKEDGELVVYYFGQGQGGGVADNLTRWKSQFKNADGSPLPESAGKVETFDVHGMKTTTLEVAGRYDPGAMPGMADTGPHDNYRLLGAVIESPGGMWFVKASGPDATMTAQRDTFRKYVASARP